ncbi:MAG TPA: BatD family protein [Thermoanaerobaculia bacterium]|nr:BatD family protein [Thermoanaerobaculia bacterium]
MVARALACALLLVAAAGAFANDLIVHPRTVRLNDLVTLTISLEDEFAKIESVSIPLQNLALVGEPSVSTEFAWINGRVTRRKVFRYRARPLATGPAFIGRIVLNAPDGQRDTLDAVQVQVVADRTSESNDAEVVLRELLASGREPLFVVAEMRKSRVYVGEPVDVTWWLYNAATVQQWQVVQVPKLAEFWAEERPRHEATERVYVGDFMVQRMPVRRVTLFPLQSGNLTIGGMTIEAAVLRRSRRGPFAMFEGELTETTFTSAPLSLEVLPIPPGPPVDAVGDLTLTCEPAVQRNGGPVVLRVGLTGLGNVRAASPPRFERAVAGTVQIEGGEVSVSRDENAFGMSRQWRYLIFPSRAGSLEIPPLTLRLFNTRAGTRRELRCDAAFFQALTATPPSVAPPLTAAPVRTTPRWPWVAAALLVLLAALMTFPRLGRELALRRAAREVVRDASPAEIRARMEERVNVDLREASDRGDAWRALRSLLDAAERERDIAVGAEKEIERRVREVLRLTARA